MLTTTRWLFLLVALISTSTSAQTKPRNNVFFGFDFVLKPIAIKWSCGGARDQDLAALDVLIAAFPSDAEEAGLPSIIDSLLQTSEGDNGLAVILEVELSDQQTEQLCAAALRLNLVWATPEQLVNNDEDNITAEQQDSWENFFQVIEDVQ